MNLKSTLVLLTFLLSFFLSGCSGGVSDTGVSDTSVSDTGVSDTGVSDTAAVLSWSAPNEREDGSVLVLTEIAGFRIYYGLETGVYHGQIDIDEHTATQVQSPMLPSGKYFFVMTTIDTDGRESVFSHEVEMTNF